MRATLEFTLPEEQVEFHEATMGGAAHAALNDISEWLRSEWKYKELPPEVREYLEQVRTRLANILDERGVNLG